MTLLRKETGNTESFINTSGTDFSSIYANSTWIIDSGATDHVSKNPPITNKSASKHTSVQLPNGGHAEITSTGSMKLCNDMTVDNVLYVPNFKANLLSISKLTRALGCNVTFYPDFCVMQDLTTRRTLV